MQFAKQTVFIRQRPSQIAILFQTEEDVKKGD